MEKSSEVYRRKNNEPKTLPWHPWHNVNQFTLITIHHNVQWPVWEKLCQSRQHRTSNTHRAELIENTPWIEPSRGCSKINVSNLASCPLFNVLWSVWDTHKSASQVPLQTFPISKLGGWMHTTASHKSSKTNIPRRSNTLDITDVMEIGRSLATEEDGGPFGIGVTLACLRQARKLLRRAAAETLHQDSGAEHQRFS